MVGVSSPRSDSTIAIALIISESDMLSFIVLAVAFESLLRYLKNKQKSGFDYSDIIDQIEAKL